MAVANALIAVEAGAEQVQGTINGLGERCGNANLVSIIPNLKLKMGMDCIPNEQLRRLREISSFVDELANGRGVLGAEDHDMAELWLVDRFLAAPGDPGSRTPLGCVEGRRRGGGERGRRQASQDRRQKDPQSRSHR